MLRTLVSLAGAAVLVATAACDKNDVTSTTMTTGATMHDAGAMVDDPAGQPTTSGVSYPMTNGNSAIVPSANGGTDNRAAVVNGAPGALPQGQYSSPGAQGVPMNAGTMSPTAPIPQAAAPNAPAAGYGNANVPPTYGNAGVINNGNSAGSMNGTRPMNQLGSSTVPGSQSNGATDAPRQAAAPNSVP